MTTIAEEQKTEPRRRPLEGRPAADPATAVPQLGALRSVAIAATFTAEGLEPPLRFMLDAAGLALDVAFAPYHQVFQELMAPQGLLARNSAGVNVVLLRLEDFLRDAAPDSSLPDLVQRTVRELADAARRFIRRSPVPAVFVVMMPSPSAAAMRSSLELATAALIDALQATGGATVLDASQIDALCDSERFDAVADRLAHIPYTDDYFAAIAIALARRIHQLLVPSHKVLVLDCDNTIWGGVVGEDGPQGIALDDEYLGVQRFAVAAQAKGALVCLASKNAEADVLEVLEARADMVLRAEHIVAHRINWEAKVSNLRSLARELNVGLDSFVFVDDNPVECGQVQEALPEVVTLLLPVPGRVTGFVEHLWAFDKDSVTQEDARRTEMYRENAARDDLEASAVDIGEFLAALQLSIDIGAPADAEWPRVAQLTQRTNQFNFTTVRRTEAEMRALAAAGAGVLSVHVRDRFGDYGLVGMAVYERRAGEVLVDTFVLSCRVLGRGVEHAIVAHLGALAVANGCQWLRLPYRRTAKNEPARAFAESIVATFAQGQGDAYDYLVPASFAAAVEHRPGHDAEAVVEARRADANKPAKPATNAAAGRSARYLRLATELTSGPAVLQAMRATSRRSRELGGAATAPRTVTERALLQSWEEILGIAGLGVDDDFFALGGSSLQAARMFADLEHRCGAHLPLTTILEAPTVSALAARADRGDIAVTDGLVALRPGGRRKLFLVHDGDGETLLYRNLARRAPADVSVFGIQPARLKNIPLGHSSVEAMAAAYVERVRAEQPVGPYLLGGMCAGGVIAYEMALQLDRAGEQVGRVLLLDAATPQAALRPHSSVVERASRLTNAMSSARQGRRGADALRAGLKAVGRKMRGSASYETRRFFGELSVRLRFALLRRVLAGNGSWPDFVPSLDFRAIYNAAERRYLPASSPRISALLVRARSGVGGDRPYSEVYSDSSFGWGSVVTDLAVVDTDGGHSSMLQEPHAVALASSLRPHFVAGEPGEPRADLSDAPCGGASASQGWP